MPKALICRGAPADKPALSLGQTPLDQSLFIMPEQGLMRDSWYLVEAAFKSNNPIHLCLFYAGLCDDGDLEPGNYAGLVNHSHDPEWTNWGQSKPYYMKVGQCLGQLLEGQVSKVSVAIKIDEEGGVEAVSSMPVDFTLIDQNDEGENFDEAWMEALEGKPFSL